MNRQALVFLPALNGAYIFFRKAAISFQELSCVPVFLPAFPPPSVTA